MRRLGKTITTALIATLVACGDSTGPAAERNNPGTGTTSLSVAASISASDVAGGFVTDFQISLWDAQGLLVSGATVTIQNGELGEVTARDRGGIGRVPRRAQLLPGRRFSPRRQPLTVTWVASAQARGVEIETRDYTSPVLADNGTTVISAENNVERAEQRIRVYRTNSVDIVGALPDSELELRIRNTVEPIVVAAPIQP